ncbi:hypothetical protein VTI28DRAFT_7598 [Corynascus sepedonium]
MVNCLKPNYLFSQQSVISPFQRSGRLGDSRDADYVDARDEFVQKHNRIARQYGIRTIPSNNLESSPSNHSQPEHRRGWFSRTFLRHGSTSSDGDSTKSDKKTKHKRSVSDLALQFVSGGKRNSLKDEDLHSLVRLCGRSKLYLPVEYSPGPLVLPTCFRATAQYLVIHGAETRGVFRVPGSTRIVNALYTYYCADGDADEISNTTCCPNLPPHIKAGTHDVASTFKRLLSVAIHGQHKDESDIPGSRQMRLKAKLIALAIETVESQLRRDLICAVFGLLCLIGCTAEKSLREDENGIPLLASDFMGYNALGIVFGPLLIGDLLNSYTKHATTHTSGFDPSSSTSREAKKERRKPKGFEGAGQPSLAVDRIHMANNITEMLIRHWQEVVKYMKGLKALRSGSDNSLLMTGLRASTSEGLALKIPHYTFEAVGPNESPVPLSPTLESENRTENPAAQTEISSISKIQACKHPPPLEEQGIYFSCQNPAKGLCHHGFLADNDGDCDITKEEAARTKQAHCNCAATVDTAAQLPADAIADADADADAAANVELTAMRAQLRQTEYECALWQARAERAERRIRLLEGKGK